MMDDVRWAGLLVSVHPVERNQTMTARRHQPTSRAVMTKSVTLAMGAALAFSVVGCTSDAVSDQSSTSTAATASDVPSATVDVSGAVTPSPDAASGGPTGAPGDTAPPSAAVPGSTGAGDAGTPADSSATAQQPPAPATTILEGAPAARTVPAIDLTATGDFGGSVTAKITQIGPVQATADLPGQTAGPAVALTIEVDNGSSAPIGLDGIRVTLADSSGAAATSTTGNSAAPFAGMMVEGGRAEGTYVFIVPPENRDPVTITVTYSTSAPAVVFAGPVASS